MSHKESFFITETDRDWVHKCFDWLIKAYGYPYPGLSPILFTEKFFPNAIAHKHTAIEPLLKDLCKLFSIEPSTVYFETEEDIRDTVGTPYEIHGTPFECDLELIPHKEGHHFKLYYANSLLRSPKRLVFNSVYQFIRIQIIKDDGAWLLEDGHEMLLYLIGIYKGCGVLLAQTMKDEGRSADGFWEEKWRYVSPMPAVVMAYSLAFHSLLIEQPSPVWKDFLPREIKSAFEKAVQYITNNSYSAASKQELNARRLYKEGGCFSKEKNFDDAIDAYQKALFLSSDETLKSILYNNIGYSLLWKQEFRKSIEYFGKAIAINSQFGYANDNIGFAYIMLGDTVTGKHYLTVAMETKNNDAAYSYRNLALYHQQRGEMQEARENFDKAYASIKMPVDFLDYYFARFLYLMEKKAESLVYLQRAVEKGEPQAISWLSEINKKV